MARLNRLGTWLVLAQAWLAQVGTVAATVPSGTGALRAPSSSTPTSLDTTSVDSVYTLPTTVVTATRLDFRAQIKSLPGQVSYVAVDPLRADITDVGGLLDELPGLRVRDYGGHFSSASVRGSSASQVKIYLDGIPLGRAGLGVTNLADLPFASLHHVEVYRGFAPSDLPAASLGGAVNLVTLRPPAGASRTIWHRGRLSSGAGDYDTRRFGLSGQARWRTWSGLALFDHLQSDGSFEYQDDNGTPLNRTDDRLSRRQNNWVRRDEALLRLSRDLPGGGRLALVEQWSGRRQGVAGLPSAQASFATLEAASSLTSLDVELPPTLQERLQARARLHHEWRRDRFADLHNEVGLGYQDNRDVTQTFGANAHATLTTSSAHAVTLLIDVRHERFTPWRRLPRERLGPDQERLALELTSENRVSALAERLVLHGTWRFLAEHDDFRGDVRTPYSRAPAKSARRESFEPRAACRLRLWTGLHLEASYGEYHRTPSFLELFGDGGSIAGSSDVVPEKGIQRDLGIDFERHIGRLRLNAEVAAFHNRADHLITFLPQSQRTFVARNIGAVRLEGEEWSLQLAPATGRRWKLEGNYTRLRSKDLGTDQSWYAGNVLPGRPEHELFARATVAAGPLELAYRFEHLGQNYLDRANRQYVARRDLHGVDLSARLRALRLQLGLRNLTDNRTEDVAGFPLPGRTVVLTSEYVF